MAQLTITSLFSEEEEERKGEGLTIDDLFSDVPSESQFTREHGQEAPNLLGQGADLIKTLAMDPIPAVQEAGERVAGELVDAKPPDQRPFGLGARTTLSHEALAEFVKVLAGLSPLDYAMAPLLGGSALVKQGAKGVMKLLPKALAAADRTAGLGVALSGAENVTQGNLGQGALELGLGSLGIQTGNKLQTPMAVAASPEAPKGMTRLFRGIPADSKEAGIRHVAVDVEGSYGRSFVTTEKAAREYAGEGGQIFYVDVPEGVFSDSSIMGEFKLGQPDSSEIAPFEVLAPGGVAKQAQEFVPSGLDPLDLKVRKAVGEAKTAADEQDILNVELHTRQGGDLRSVHKEFVEDPSMGQAEYQRRLNVARKGEGDKAPLRSLTEHLTPDQIDQVSFRMTQHPWAKSEDFTPARAQDAITKWINGEPLQPNEIKLFTEVFGDKAGEAAAKGLTGSAFWGDVLNIPRAVMASGDMSAFLRQNLVFTISRPITSMKALGTAAPSLMPTKLGKVLPGEWGEDAYQTLTRNLAEHPASEMAGQFKLATTGLDNISPREEQFMSSIAETLPIIGPFVRASGRFHVGFLNKVRMDVFGDISKGLVKSGFSPKNDPKLFEGLANYVNVMTGRGGLGDFERSAKWLNGIAFSPRFASSRLQMTGAGDAVDLVTKIATLGKGGTKWGFYSQIPAPIRKEAMRDVAATMSVLIGAFSLMKLSPDVEVETNWRSADFAKGRVGKTRIDIGAGTVQYLRLYAQIAEASANAITADPGERWENFKAPRQKLTGQLVDESPMQKVARAAMYKESPTARAAHRALEGEDPFPEGIKEFAPLAIQDFTEALEEHGLLGGAAAGAGAFFGLGLQTYDAPDSPEVQAREQKAQAQGAEAREREAWRRVPDTRTPEQRSTERLERSDKDLLRADVNDMLRNLILQGEDALARRLARKAREGGLRPDLEALATAVGRQQMEALTEGSQ